MNVTASVSSLPKSETDIIGFALQQAHDRLLPLALWRLPHQAQKHLILSNTAVRLTETIALESSAPGFVFAPFDKTSSSIFLPADIHGRFENKQLKSDSPDDANFASWLYQSQASVATPPTTKNKNDQGRPMSSVDSEFAKMVDGAAEAIARGEMEKVVLSRKKVISLPDDFDVVATFEKLCDAYPHALISFVSIPGIGQWMGATPEVLVRVEDQSIFRTIALAGTLPYTEGMDLKSIAWTQKEIEEQALVERYIISCFKKIRLREYEEHGPKTVVAGNLVHLRSDFTVDLRATNFPQLGSVMLELLHPTSAVCGSPIEKAFPFIRQHEGHDREFYCGYLGPVNIERSVDIFVNLRCMKLYDRQAVLFAGAGITEDSVGERELEETELKFRTLLNVLR